MKLIIPPSEFMPDAINTMGGGAFFVGKNAPFTVQNHFPVAASVV
jgi:hypothetical protein